MCDMTSITIRLNPYSYQFGLIAYECQNNKWGYVAIVFAAYGGKMFI